MCMSRYFNHLGEHSYFNSIFQSAFIEITQITVVQ